MNVCDDICLVFFEEVKVVIATVSCLPNAFSLHPSLPPSLLLLPTPFFRSPIFTDCYCYCYHYHYHYFEVRCMPWSKRTRRFRSQNYKHEHTHTYIHTKKQYMCFACSLCYMDGRANERIDGMDERKYK